MIWWHFYRIVYAISEVQMTFKCHWMCFIDLVFKICCVRGVDDQSFELLRRREDTSNNMSVQIHKETGDVFHQDLYRGVAVASNVGVNISKQRMERIRNQSNCEITQSMAPSALSSTKQKGNNTYQAKPHRQHSNSVDHSNDKSPLLVSSRL